MRTDVSESLDLLLLSLSLFLKVAGIRFRIPILRSHVSDSDRGDVIPADRAGEDVHNAPDKYSARSDASV